MKKVWEIVSKIAEESGDTKRASKEFLDAFMDTVSQGLVEDGEVEVEGLGKFEKRKRAAFLGRNPVTGGRVEVPESYNIFFKASNEFTEIVNKEL